MKKKRKELSIVGSTKKGFKKHAIRVTNSSVSMVWRTPKSLLKLIKQVSGDIMLDPSASANPKHHFAPTSLTGPGHGVDGLTVSWRGHGVVYCNPPYGRSIKQWIVKAATEASATPHRGHIADGDSTESIFLLIPARPDTRWFQEELLPHMSAVCFWKGRLKFSGHKDSAPFPSLIVYFGSKKKRFRKIFRRYGWVVLNNN